MYFVSSKSPYSNNLSSNSRDDRKTFLLLKLINILKSYQVLEMLREPYKKNHLLKLFKI